MSTPQNVINFRSRTGYQEAVRKQRDCQQEQGPLTGMLKTISDGLDAGMSPGEIRRIEGARYRAQTRKAAEFLALFVETPPAAAAFLRELADELEGKP